MLRSNFDNEIIELSNNLEDIWDSIIKKYEIIFDTLTEVQKQSIVDNDLELTKDIPMIVSIYDTGSLLPLSISRRDAVPFFKFNFFFLNIKLRLSSALFQIFC